MVSLIIGIVRTKAMALLLGPGGFGLMGLYGSIVDLALSLAGMGIKSSGVRQIAASVSTGEQVRIARTVTVLRKTSVLLGVFGALVLAAFSSQVSTLTFGTDQHAVSVAVLSLAVLFSLIAGGQAALVQGMRRILDLAKMGILGTLFGTLISVPVVYYLREDGVVPSLVVVAALSVLTSWWYSRKVHVEPVTMSRAEVCLEAASLLKLGVSFMASGFLVMGAAYAVRIIVVRDLGLPAAGLYQAAWMVGGLYVGFVLQAMGADFYPRLVGAAGDHRLCNRLVNEQAQVSMLLASPGVIATLTFAPLVLVLLYSSEFGAAVDVLRWTALGMALRVLTWPMGFIIVAKGEQWLFIATETAWAVVSVALAWICIRSFGLDGAGVAFFGSYVFHGLIVYPIVRRLTGFRWSAAARVTGLVFAAMVSLVFCTMHLLPTAWATLVGTLAVALSALHSIRTLASLSTIDRLPRSMQRLLGWLRPAGINH